MKWQIRIHHRAYRFLERLHNDKRRSIEEKLRELIKPIESGILSYRRLDICRLRGEWEGFLHLRLTI